MNDKIPITKTGKDALEEELRELKNVARPEVIEQIAIARAHGDLSENAEYAAAKEKQGFIEGRIQEIGDRLARAEVIDPTSINSEKIVFGATVTLYDEAGAVKVYQIVGEPEADLNNGKISVVSPMARAMLGKLEGDEVVVKTPKGELSYEVSKIEYK